VFGKTVVSPPRAMVLDGISLRVVEELCGRLGISFGEWEIPVADVPRMGEAMLAGTGFGLAGVRSIDGVELPWPGPVFRRLLAAWSESVGADVAGQFLVR
jgi:branched-subunit amino acid aminotransferase/4-amino-4-deoxychorismate lyase